MKKLTIFVTMILAAMILSAEMYTGIPDFLPYGVDSMGSPRAPGWLSKKVDPNGFQGAFHYDANGNRHEGKANPYLRVFYENSPGFELESKLKERQKKIEKMLMWIIKKICDVYGFRIPGWLI
jgi:hypothetical protein